MSGFDRPVLVRIGDDGDSFIVLSERTYHGSQGDSWTIPAGFTTDFATIPAAVSWAIPKLGAYSLAAVVHDLLCEGLNNYYQTRLDRTAAIRETLATGREVEKPDFPFRPAATAVDTDAIFRKIARSYGVDRVTATLLWVGVRWGALANPARRAGWLRTAPAVLGYSLLFSPVLVPATVLALVGGAVLRAASALSRLPSRLSRGASA